MSTFTMGQQADHRKAFIKECHLKAWSARCHADHIGKQVDDLIAQYQKLQEEHRQLDVEYAQLEEALDHHTYDNRQKRRGIEAKRDELSQQMKLIGESAQRGQQAMQSMLQSAESNLELATFAETWEWKEAEAGQAKEG